MHERFLTVAGPPRPRVFGARRLGAWLLAGFLAASAFANDAPAPAAPATGAPSAKSDAAANTPTPPPAGSPSAGANAALNIPVSELPRPAATAETNQPDATFFHRQVEVARTHREAKQFAEATRVLVSLLESVQTPEDAQRLALLELAAVAESARQPARAQQILAQALKTFPQDAVVPEILLRQGRLYREMGALRLAVSKFYAVMTTALAFKADRLDYYKRLVLEAQTEIAETYYLEGDYERAVEFLNRLLKLDTSAAHREEIEYKRVRSLAALDRHAETVVAGENFVEAYPRSRAVPEVRFLLSAAFKQLGRDREATVQVLRLLESQEARASQAPGDWIYWQQRAGNDIANQFYKQGDFLNALEIYLALAELDGSPAWQLPVLYQIGLVYERLMQPEKARDTFGRIVAREPELTGPAATPGLRTVVDMARWRREHLEWQEKTAISRRLLQHTMHQPTNPPPVTATP